MRSCWRVFRNLPYLHTVKSLWGVLFTVILVACGGHEPDVDSESEVIEATRDSVNFSVKGDVSLEGMLKLGNLNVYVVDEELNVLDTLDAIVRKSAPGKYAFLTKSYHGYSTLLQFDYACYIQDSATVLEFTEYVDLAVDSTPTLSLHRALMSNRVRLFVQNDDFDLALAQHKANRELRTLFEVDRQDDNLMYWLPYVYSMNISRDKSSGESFDESFFNLVKDFKESLGKSKTWKDFVNPVFVADSLLNVPEHSELFENKDNARFFEDFWRRAYGFSECDSALVGTPAQNKKKESEYYGRTFVCTLDSLSKDSWGRYNHWKWVMRRNASVASDTSAVADSVKTDSLLSDPGVLLTLAAYTDSAFGKCTPERKKEKERLNSAYYICEDSAWQSIDRVTYFLGACDRSKYVDMLPYIAYGTMYKNDSVGYYLCNKDVWTKINAPTFYKDKCNEGAVVEYDSTFFTCHGSVWSYSTPAELENRIVNGVFCNGNRRGKRIQVDETQYYNCDDDKWTLTNYTDEEIALQNIVKKNKISEHYCDSVANGVSPIWLPKDSLLLSCSLLPYTNQFFTLASIKWDSYLDASIMATGKLRQNDYDLYLDVEHDGIKYEFSQTTEFRLIRFVADSVAYEMSKLNGRHFVTREVDHGSMKLSSFENRSESFEPFYEKWIDDVAEVLRCFPWVDSKCKEPSEKAAVNNVVLKTGKPEEAYVTWEMAKDMCPSGFHIPDTSEWMTPDFYTPNRLNFIGNPVDVGMSVVYNVFWANNEFDDATQYCYEQAWFRQTNYSQFATVAGPRIIECPKDLFPMVQVVCVED